MITRYFRTLKDSELKIVDSYRSGLWIHVVAPTEVELDELSKELQLDREVLDDAQDFFEVPRLERNGSVTYFFTRYLFDDSDEDTDTAPLLIAVGDSFVLTVSLREVPQFERFVTGREVVHTTQKTKLFIQFMQAITGSFERQLITLRRMVHRDRAKLRNIGNREIVRFVNYENRLNDMVAAVMPTNFSLQQVMNGHYMPVYDEDRELMDDLRIDNTQVVESARSLLKTIQNVRNAAESIFTNTLNNRIKTLTVLTILLTIPNVFSSLYGMNVSLPLMNSPEAFWLVLVVIMVTVGGALWAFKRNNWL